MKTTQLFIALSLAAALWGGHVSAAEKPATDSATLAVVTTYKGGQLSYRFYNKYTLQATDLPYIAGKSATFTIPVADVLKKMTRETYNSTTVSDVAPVLFFFSDWTCPACRAMHKALHAKAAKEPSFFAYAVPAYNTADGRAIQRMLLILRQEDTPAYEKTTQALMDEKLEATPDKVSQYIQSVASVRAKYLISLDPTKKVVYKPDATPEEKQAAMDYSAVSMAELTLNLSENILRENIALTGKNVMPKTIVGNQTLNGYNEDLTLLDKALKQAATESGKYMKTLKEAVKTNKSVITLATPTVVLPAVAKGEISSATVKYTNTGSEPLVISGIGVSCGCTTVKEPAKQRVIAPGQSGELEVKVNTHGYVSTVYTQLYLTCNASNAREGGLVIVDLETPLK